MIESSLKPRPDLGQRTILGDYPASDSFHTVSEVAAYLRMSRRQLWRKIAAGEFPSPIKTGGREACLRKSDVDGYVDRLVVEQRKGRGAP